MEENGRVLSPTEAAEYGEFQRTKRQAEIADTLKKVMQDCSRRELQPSTVEKECERARNLGAYGVIVSPLNVLRVKRIAQNSGICVCCAVGGTGESFPSIKQAEAKKAARQGAKEILLTLCYSALTSGNFSYLKKEIKRVRRSCKRQKLIISLCEHTLSEEQIAVGVKAACAAKADGVCVRGETQLVVRALQASGGKLFVEASNVENSEQLRLLVRAGAARVCSREMDVIAEELYASVFGEEGNKA